MHPLKSRKLRRLCGRLILFGVIAFLVAFYELFLAVSRCSEAESKDILHTICEEFHEGRLVGNLCSELCSSNAIRYSHCLNYPAGKKIFVARWHNKTVVLKTKNPYLSGYDSLGFLGPRGYVLPSLQELEKMTRHSLLFNLGINASKTSQLFYYMWPINLLQYLREHHSLTDMKGAMESFWSLVQQDEYVLMYFFKNYEFFPDIYGTCGHFYVVDFVPPGKILNPSVGKHFSRGNSFRERIIVAIGLLKVLLSFETDFHEKLHFCDMKGENFGVSYDLSVKAIDLDMAVFDSRLKSQFRSELNCSKHKDCDYFDCHGWCNADTHKCDSRRVNNNLQSICMKVFRNSMSNAYSGVFVGAPQHIQQQLEPLLDECSQMGTLINPFVSQNQQINVMRKFLAVLEDINHELRHEMTKHTLLHY